MYTVYKHTTPSGKSYIGLTSMGVKKRISAGYEHNIYFSRAIKKYGAKIQTEVIADNLTQEEADLIETWMIASLDTTNRAHGYNIAFGGHCGGFNDETKAKISAKAKLRRVPASEEKKKKLSESCHTKKRIRRIQSNGIVTEWESLSDAARYLGVSYRCIRHRIEKKRLKKTNERWEYVEQSSP